MTSKKLKMAEFRILYRDGPFISADRTEGVMFDGYVNATVSLAIKNIGSVICPLSAKNQTAAELKIRCAINHQECLRQTACSRCARGSWREVGPALGRRAASGARASTRTRFAVYWALFACTVALRNRTTAAATHTCAGAVKLEGEGTTHVSAGKARSRRWVAVDKARGCLAGVQNVSSVHPSKQQAFETSPLHDFQQWPVVWSDRELIGLS